MRITRGLVKLLQERTADGYVFRTDLRLRPDPGSTQIAVSTAAALDYYESIGRNWERAAMIKGRACAGDIAAGDKLLLELSPFIWRKYLDFAAVADIHSMKRQIHAYRGHGEIAVEGHNVKLGRGGIREIEFFVQTQQLIAGGRHPELRGRETLAMLDVLAEREWIGAAARDELGGAYRFLRMLEHRLQMVADEQTHTLPGDREGIERFARFFGYADRDSFAEALLGHLRNVQRHYATLFEIVDDHESSAEIGSFCGVMAIALLLDVSSLEVARQKTSDLDQEFRSNGLRQSPGLRARRLRRLAVDECLPAARRVRRDDALGRRHRRAGLRPHSLLGHRRR